MIFEIEMRRFKESKDIPRLGPRFLPFFSRDEIQQLDTAILISLHIEGFYKWIGGFIYKTHTLFLRF